MRNYLESSVSAERSLHVTPTFREGGLFVGKDRIVFPFKGDFAGVKPEDCFLHPGIPQAVLFPTQTYSGYIDRCIRKIDREYKNTGGSFLRDFPLVLCALPEGQKGMSLAIIDGHTRARRAGVYTNISSFPSLIVRVDTAASLHKESNVEAYERKLRDKVMQAISDFSMCYSMRGKTYHPPALVQDDLAQQLRDSLYHYF